MKHIRTFGFILFFISFLGCTRQIKDTSTLTFSFSQNGAMSTKPLNFDNTPASHMSQSVGVYASDEGPQWNTVLNPSTIADVNCYLVAISGPEVDMRRNTCTTTSGQSLYVGRFNGAIPAGQQISLEVPSGPQREIMIVGFKSAGSACRDFRTSEPDSANLSQPHIIGKVTQNLNPGTVQVTVPVTVNASNLKIADCQGPDFNLGGGNQMYFGDAPNSSGSDYNASTFSMLTTDPAANLRAGYARITSLTTVGDSVDVVSNAGTARQNIVAGDEVMIIVMGGRGQMGPNGNLDYDSCGYRGWTGRYQFTRVRTANYTSGNYNYSLERGTFLDSFWKDADGDGILNEAGDITTANTMLSANAANFFCYIQIVRVPHFRNITLATGATLTTQSFSWAGAGGILAFRAQSLTMTGSASINMDGAGYQGNPTQRGDGVRGQEACSATPSYSDNGGGCSDVSFTPPSYASGGGGHGNSPQSPTYIGPWGDSGGEGSGASAFGGSGVGDDCGRVPGQAGYCFGNLNYKMFMGGASGANVDRSTSGVGGGGIIFVAAKTFQAVDASGVNEQTLSAKGTDGTATYGIGGGAGGSVHFINAQNLSSLDGSGGYAYPLISVKGGAGSIWNNSITYSGGGGGAGRAHVTMCSHPLSTASVDATGGLSPSSTYPGINGQSALTVLANLVCQ